MITLIKPDTTGLIINCDDYYIRELPSGLDELNFNISIWDEAFPLITEETELIEESDGQRTSYLVKAIDGGGEDATVKAQINVDEWKTGILLNFSQNAKAATIVEAAKPNGWTVVDSSGSTETGKVEEPGATPLQILDDVQQAIPGISFRFNVAAKTITIYDLYNGPNLGAFLTRELNLKAVQYKGKSTDFITRLYPYGRDDLSIASVNSGLTYIDNNTYSNKIISEYWQRDQFTDAQNLKDAAIEYLKERCVPERAFSCEVADLAAAYPDKYDYLSFTLFSQVALIDETRSDAKIMHRVTERWRYPFHPAKNKVILSNAPKRITVQVLEALKPVTSDRIAQGAVTRGRIGTAAVTTPKIDDGSVTVTKIGNGAVWEDKIYPGAVTNTKIQDEAISLLKFNQELQGVWADLIYAKNAFIDMASISGGKVISLTVRVLYLNGYTLIAGDGFTVHDHVTAVGNTDHTADTSYVDGHDHSYTYYTAYDSISDNTQTINAVKWILQE